MSGIVELCRLSFDDLFNLFFSDERLIPNEDICAIEDLDRRRS